jgi:hypothetical protein
MLATALIPVALGLGLRLNADDQKVPLDKVPHAVTAAVKARFPAAVLKAAEKETEDDKTTYEVSLENAGRQVTVSLSEKGEIAEIETELAGSELPGHVIEIISKRFPGSKLTKTEEIVEIEDGKEEKAYELAVVTADGKTLEVHVDSDGEIESREADDEWTSIFLEEKTDLLSTGRNPFFILEPGYQLVLEGGKVQLTITVLQDTKLVDGVETRVVEERETKDGQLSEVSRNYVAISRRTGSVYYFGEDVDTYKDGKVAGHGGSWLAGIGGARFGLIMPGLPLLGAKYRQEIAPGKAMDQAEIVSLSEVVETAAGEFKQCLRTEESSALEPGEKESKVYAPGIGLVREESLNLVRRVMVEGGK